jgi:hypothetical protein
MMTRLRRLGSVGAFCIGIAVLSAAPRALAQQQIEPAQQTSQQPSGLFQLWQSQLEHAPSELAQSGQAQQGQQQQPPAANGAATSGQTSSDQKPGGVNNSPATNQGGLPSKDRLFYTLPNFLTVENSAQTPPLTAGQKFKITLRSSFDYVQYPWYAALAGISQAENSEAGYGQGAEGYGKRFGQEFADGTIENFMVNAVVPSLLHTDPRYYQLGKGGFWHRTEYALSRLVITRTDAGNRTFNFAEIGGSAAAAAISTYSYHPQADRNLSNTASTWGTQIGYDALSIFAKEFWPDIRRKIKKKHSGDQD